MSVQKNDDRKKLDQKLPLMPWFVQQFIDYKRPDLSPSTLLEYIRDYESFSAGCVRRAYLKPAQIPRSHF